MIEKKLKIEDIAPVELFGINDAKLKLIKNRFPELKVVARGELLKVSGDEESVNQFEMTINVLIDYYNKHGNLNEDKLQQLLSGNLNREKEDILKAKQNIIAYGNNGLVIKARTPNQIKMVESMATNDMLFAVGPAGTGKTYTAVAMAVNAIKNKEVKRIVLTRPAVEAGENLGFLPGDLKDKLDPYLQPLYDALFDMISADKLSYYIENRIIEIAPLAYMRGRTLDNAFVILDEAQNATESQLKMFLTRMGSSAKFIITGDASQTDLPKHQPSGLIKAVKVLNDVKGIAIVELDGTDVIRHKLVKQIIDKYI